MRKLLLLICGVQLKLKQLGCYVALSVSQEWSKRIDASYLKGYYIMYFVIQSFTKATSYKISFKGTGHL